MSDTDHPASLSPAEARQIDQACDRFEAAWKAGRQPRPEEYLGMPGEPARSALLRQLLLLDWDYRRHAGEDPRPGDYYARFPSHRGLIEEISSEISIGTGSTQPPTDPANSHDTSCSDGLVPEFPEPTGAADGADRYDLLQEVGHGGIGIVFRGRDRVLGRDLAVKVLREDYRDQPVCRRRFTEEARIGSRLQHPAIVPVYELGWFGDGRPYFTMKLVEGRTFADLLQDRSDPGQDLPRLLGIFEQVCQAIAYAHSRGVIHRDLKPSNVMVGAFGEVQVMDWGFAKVLAGPNADQGVQKDDSSGWAPGGVGSPLSRSGVMMGTPSYMPPEQAQGQGALIDARTDVFALGAILCEVLTGRPPYVGGSIEAVCRQAVDGKLEDAHARLASCSADEALRDLARRCLAADRLARPPDAGAVASDLRAWFASTQERLRQAQLDRAAAEARAQEAQAKAKAERRARRLFLALAAALLAGGAVAVWQAIVADHAKQAALNAAEAEKEAKEATRAKEAETRTVLEFVQNRIFAAARPKGLGGGLGSDVSLRQAIQAALPVVENSFAGQPLVEARLRMVLGRSFTYLGELQTAAKQYERARALYTEHLGADHNDTLQSVNNLASIYAQLDRQDEALALRKEVLEVRLAKLGPDHPDTLFSMNNLANSYQMQRQPEKALELRKTVLERRKAILGPDHEDTLWAMYNLAGTYATLGRTEDALRLFEDLLAKRTATLGRDHLDTVDCLSNVAVCYHRLGRDDKALQFHEETWRLRKARLDADHPLTLDSMANVADTYSYLSRDSEALELHEKALKLRQAKLGPKHRDTIASFWAVAGGRIRKFEKARDVQGCRATAEMCENQSPTTPDGLYTIACYRGVTAAVLRTTDKSPEAARQADAEADKAMAWLKKAITAGYRDVANMKTDRDLDALRDRADFQKLFADLQRRGP
jgi:tRNA A-37 threonylcarbamoyl transferase component Bud32